MREEKQRDENSEQTPTFFHKAEDKVFYIGIHIDGPQMFICIIYGERERESRASSEPCYKEIIKNIMVGQHIASQHTFGFACAEM